MRPASGCSGDIAPTTEPALDLALLAQRPDREHRGLLAAALVARFQSLWPDLLVGVGVALLFLRTAVSVLRQSMIELLDAGAAPAESLNGLREGRREMASREPCALLRPFVRSLVGFDDFVPRVQTRRQFPEPFVVVIIEFGPPLLVTLGADAAERGAA